MDVLVAVVVTAVVTYAVLWALGYDRRLLGAVVLALFIGIWVIAWER